MTIENQKNNIREELARAHEALRAAELLFEKHLLNDGVSRLYYYAFHVVKALLLSKGLEPKSHEGSLQQLGMHFVKTGILLPADSHVFSRLMKYQQEADYNPSYSFTEQDTHQFKKEAIEFERKILEYLKSVRFIE